MTFPATGLRSGHRRRTFVSMILALTLGLGAFAVGSGPLRIAGAASYKAGGWTTAAAATPTALKPGQTTTVKVSIVASSNRHGGVTIEVHSPTTMVLQKSWNFQWFWKGKVQTFTIPVAIAAGSETGQFTVKVKLSDSWSRATQHYNQNATTFTVSPLSTTAPTTAPAATTPPVTAPPATTPPVTAAPTTAAPTTAPPVTAAPTTAPPATAAPTTAAPATVPSNGGTPGAGTVLWSEDFSTAAGMDRLLKQISDGDNVANGNPMQQFNGDHDHSCGSPATTRPLVEDYKVSTHFWHCLPGGDPAKGHMMTGINTVGYVIMAFSPKADNGTTARVFPATANQVCWDQNITDLGTRKFTQLIVVNADRYRTNGNGINYVNPDFNTNGGSKAIHVQGDDFVFVNLRNSVQYFSGQTKVFTDWSGYTGSADKATRFTICVRDNGNGTVTRTQARPGGAVSTVTGPGSFPAGPRVFIIEDDSYNPMKSYRDEGVTQVVSDPFTWHWDNLRISST